MRQNAVKMGSEVQGGKIMDYVFTTYERINGKSYVDAETYDKVLYAWKAAEDKLRNSSVPIEEIEKLKCENVELSNMLKKEAAKADDFELLAKMKESEIQEAEKKIEWYKGQIEAYQYCMNCRR